MEFLLMISKRLNLFSKHMVLDKVDSFLIEISYHLVLIIRYYEINFLRFYYG